MLRVIILLRILEPSNYRVIDTHLENENWSLISLLIAEKIRILYVSDIDYWKEASILIFLSNALVKYYFLFTPELRLYSIADDLSNYYWKNKKGNFLKKIYA